MRRAKNARGIAAAAEAETEASLSTSSPRAGAAVADAVGGASGMDARVFVSVFSFGSETAVRITARPRALRAALDIPPDAGNILSHG